MTGGWLLFRTMREQALTPTLARQVAEWCEGRGDFESARELHWAAAEADKWRSKNENENENENEGVLPVGQADDIIARIDEVLSVDSMSWSPVPEDEQKRILAGEQDERPREWVNLQIHAIPVEQVSEWTAWWDGLSESDQEATPWYIVCHTHKVVGERSVTCGCGNPSSSNDFR
ncbi:hypothetical protein [Mycobacteroides abscessus]|uniref:hypothetical protein n=1 Tax=Mycobacteroides abscessus TaxID=36809 RepID=UPI001A983BD4|nr:hypothetical protein [Mycobacteroides abscessus]